ncbi:Maf family protein [Luteibaculum oceani]|uniref:dTTP/UTP pyrophosphatase n=1 Tax=Luteibaculum oceani TaxID=1294296 RepID=A0A5C6UXT0_9FLAO|nr:Maf family protein [Luteibaculum oceani]TXC77051.1 septum formation protein Maf [Luteibaculum oceani]
MNKPFLPKLKIVLGSKSPRRKELLTQLGLNVRVEAMGVEETYPEELSPEEVVLFLAAKKAEAYKSFGPNEVLITSDTIVVRKDEILGKPKDLEDAGKMLHRLSDASHNVYTAVCINAFGLIRRSVVVKTKVHFKALQQSEIDYYLKNGKPLDKAGAYGIQEWIGMVAVEKIEGSYYNVVGLPVQEVVKILEEINDSID